MRGALRFSPLVLLLLLMLRPASAGAFTISLPADSAVKVESPSRLAFTVRTTGSEGGLSRLSLRFPPGYRVARGSAPGGWTVELRPGGSEGASGEISFRTEDEVKCTRAIAPGHSVVFGVEVIAPASRAVTPDSLASAEAEQSCRGMVLEPPDTLPSWDRLGLEALLEAAPPMVGLGGPVRVTMTVTNLSTVELTDVSALLRPTGTGSVRGVEASTPPTLTLAPGASGNMTWTARAVSAGSVSFSGQAMTNSVASLPIRSNTLSVADLEVSLKVTPERLVSGEKVQVRMAVTNRGPVTVAYVAPSTLTFEGTAAASVVIGPSPTSLAELEPGKSATFTWDATIVGGAGATYAFSSRASAEWDGILSANAVSNHGALVQGELASKLEGRGGSLTVGQAGLSSTSGGAAGSTPSTGAGGQGSAGGAGSAAGSGASGQGSGGGGTSGASSGGGAPPAPPSSSLQFIGINHNGSQTGGSYYSGELLRDLRILVQWQNLSGTHTQRLDLWSPNGSLYQRLSSQFPGTSTVTTQLPVGGTWITQHSLFGAWRVDVYLDGGRMPITSGVFVLDP